MTYIQLSVIMDTNYNIKKIMLSLNKLHKMSLENF